MKNATITTLLTLGLLLAANVRLAAQWDDDVNRIRIGVRTFIPNIVGLHGEYILPAAGNRLGAAMDFSRIALSSLASELSDAEGVHASYTYFALGANFYLGGSGRAKGPYIGTHFQRLVGKTSIKVDADNSAKGKAYINALDFVFGLRTGGHFLFGFEIGAGKPLGNFKGTTVDETNGVYTVENYSEPFFLPFVPVLNFTTGVAF